MRAEFKKKSVFIFIGIAIIIAAAFCSCYPGYKQFRDLKMSSLSFKKQWQYIVGKLNFKGSIGIKDYTVYVKEDGTIESWHSIIAVKDKNKTYEYYLCKSYDSSMVAVRRLSKKASGSSDKEVMAVNKFIKYMDTVYKRRKDFFADASDKYKYDFYFSGGETPSWKYSTNYLTVYTIDHENNINSISKNQGPMPITGACICYMLDKDYYKRGSATIVFKK